MTNPAIFVSYSWKPESKAVVDEIQSVLKTQNIEIQRDINVLNYKGKITEFMQLIGKGKIIILVIGKDYLESENCMYELMQIASQGDIYERIVPIYLPSANIHKVILRAKYVKLWTEQYKEIENLDATTLVNIPQEDVHLYRAISQEIGKLMQFLANINALSVEMHQENNWKDAIHTIKSMMQKLGTSESNNNNSTQTNSIKSLEEFKTHLLDRIERQDLDTVFIELEKVYNQMESSQKSTYSRLDKEFQFGKYDFEFVGRVKVFLNKLELKKNLA